MGSKEGVKDRKGSSVVMHRLRDSSDGRWEKEMDADRKLPVDHPEELALEHVEFRDRDAADFGIDAVTVEGITETLAGHGNRGDHEAMAGEGGEDKDRHPDRDLIDIMQGDE